MSQFMCIVFVTALFLLFIKVKFYSQHVQIEDEIIGNEDDEFDVQKEKLFNRLLEYEGICNDLDIFTMKIENEPNTQTTNPPNEENNLDIRKRVLSIKDESVPETEYKSAVVVYLAVGILIASVCKALFDVYKARTESNTDPDSAEVSRRCSLAELTVCRHIRKDPQTLHNRRTIQLTRRASVMSGSPAVETVTAIPPAINKTVKLLGGRPPPLVRRSSFPVSFGAAVGTNCTVPGWNSPMRSRRPSIDSEDDSSTDSRKRVRIIRRH